MGNKNYSKHFKFNNNRNKNANNEEVTKVINQEVENVNEEVSTLEINQTVDNIIETISGVVTGCAKLNVRKGPSKDAEVLCIINESSPVVVKITESTEDFHKVITASGIEGYCMKKFINVV